MDSELSSARSEVLERCSSRCLSSSSEQSNDRVENLLQICVDSVNPCQWDLVQTSYLGPEVCGLFYASRESIEEEPLLALGLRFMHFHAQKLSSERRRYQHRLLDALGDEVFIRRSIPLGFVT
jgi:hypothetical protein